MVLMNSMIDAMIFWGYIIVNIAFLETIEWFLMIVDIGCVINIIDIVNISFIVDKSLFVFALKVR